MRQTRRQERELDEPRLTMKDMDMKAFCLPWVVVVAGLLAACTSEKARWDEEIKQLCKKDGGVTILERVPVSRKEFDAMPKIDVYASIPSKDAAKVTDKVYWEESVSVLNEWNPRVRRTEQLVKRRADERVVARVVTYSRVGGDAPSPAHSSSFVCPDPKEIFAQREKLFVIEGSR